MRSKLVQKTRVDKMAEILLAGKRLGELKVGELKAELAKRGLQKYGIKTVLVNRLKNAILREALTQVGVMSGQPACYEVVQQVRRSCL